MQVGAGVKNAAEVVQQCGMGVRGGLAFYNQCSQNVLVSVQLH
jgi:hypothetical protein